MVFISLQSTGRSQWVHPRADCVIYGVAVLGASQAAVGVRGFVRGEGWLKAGASVVKQHWGSNLRVQVKEGYEAIFEDDVLIAEHCFPSKFLELCENGTYRAVPPLPPPSRNESFPSVLDGMVEPMLVQFPPGYYMLYGAQNMQKPVSVRGISFSPDRHFLLSRLKCRADACLLFAWVMPAFDRLILLALNRRAGLKWWGSRVCTQRAKYVTGLPSSSLQPTIILTGA